MPVEKLSPNDEHEKGLIMEANEFITRLTPEDKEQIKAAAGLIRRLVMWIKTRPLKRRRAARKAARKAAKK